MKSTLFLRDLTCIDHAKIDSYGQLSGGSYNLDVLVSGDVEQNEQVVIDFSKCKKLIKDLIDDFDHGFDHKCWVSDFPIKEIPHTNNFRVETPYLKLEGPEHLFRPLNPTLTEEQNVQLYLQSHLQEIYPTVKVEVHLRPIGFYRGGDARILFRYAHGLKHSSSCGCKRIAHGHLSFLELKTTDFANRNLVGGVLHDIQSYIRNVYFAHRENVIVADSKFVTVGYTCDAGDDYQIELNTDVHDVIILDNETTVENLTEWITEKFRHQLEAAGVTRLYMSEGLMKGAMVEV